MPYSQYFHLKSKAQTLISKGRTYSEIKSILKVNIPKSTLSFWSKEVELSDRYAKRLNFVRNFKISNGRENALRAKNETRKKYLESLYLKNKNISLFMNNNDFSKVALTLLYFAEGSRSRRGSLTFGNSDPFIIKLFLKLLRSVYKIDETKFRCTVQCRADQDIKKLQRFWSFQTQIPLKKFYKARIDKRTIGKPTRKTNYMGVCRIDYFSGDIYNELLIVGDILNKSFV